MTAESEEGEKEDNALNHSEAKAEEEAAAATAAVSDKTEQREEKQDEEDKEAGAPALTTGKHKRSEDQTNTEEESVEKKLKTETLMSTGCALPPYNPSKPVGMEFLIPKTGFFCKVCNRFFSGTKEAEISHCKTLKHYENLQKYLLTADMATVTAKPDSS